MKKVYYLLLLYITSHFTLMAQSPAAHQINDYIPLLKGKKVGLVANHTSTVGDKHLIDVLVENGINVVSIFAPEHGFRGTAAEGEKVDNEKDSKTRIPILSLYGNKKKPAANLLKNIDYMVFDMQDVGTRFFTYVSTMHYIMEACAENNIPLMVLDRPNPNGFYVDGPMLDPSCKSFIGMHAVPAVHGMTLGEMATMINGQGWLANKVVCNLTVVRCKNYTHQSRYSLPIKPSPNLPNMQAVYLYPSTCLFEGTPLSLGRGTEFPFQVFGSPAYKNVKGYDFTFTPKGKPKAAIKTVLDGQICYGVDLRTVDADKAINGQINLTWLIEAYKNFKKVKPQEKFFNNTFKLLAGTTALQTQIESGKTAEQIRASWQKDLDKFKTMRKQYLLYE